MTPTLILTVNPTLPSRLLISPSRGQANALQAETGLEMGLEALLVVEVLTQQATTKVCFHPRKAPLFGTFQADFTRTAFRDRGPSYENRSHPPDGVARHPDRLRGMIAPDTQNKQAELTDVGSERHPGRGRGGRGGRGRGRGGVPGDRHPNRTGIT